MPCVGNCWTNNYSSCREESEIVLKFVNGKPAFDQSTYKSEVHFIVHLNQLIGDFGHGRYIWLEEISSGKKVQEVREAPAAMILFDAYRRIESACLTSEEIRTKLDIEQIWVREASEGNWFSSLRKASQAFIEALSYKVNGEIRYVINQKSFIPISMTAKNPLYIVNREKYEQEFATNAINTDN